MSGLGVPIPDMKMQQVSVLGSRVVVGLGEA